MRRLVLLLALLAVVLAWRWRPTEPWSSGPMLPITPELDEDSRDAGWAW